MQAFNRLGRRIFSGTTYLSPAEIKVFRLVCQGLKNKEIAEKNFVCVKTVKFHLTNIYKKIGCKTRFEAISRFNLALYDRELMYELKLPAPEEGRPFMPYYSDPDKDELIELPGGGLIEP